MAEQGGAVILYGGDTTTESKKNSSTKIALTQILRGGAIVEVTTVEQAKIAESAGACAVVISAPRPQGVNGVLRMPDPSLIMEIKRTISIPVMARARVGHFVEAQVLEATGVDYIDENEVLTVADENNFINKHNFRSPFSGGCRNLGDALRRLIEGAVIVRIQGDLLSTGSISTTVKSVRSLMGEIRMLNSMDADEVFAYSKKIAAPYDLVAQTKQMGRLPVPLIAAGGIVTPADAAMMLQLGCDGVFVGSEVFNLLDPYRRLNGIVQAVRHYREPQVLLEVSSGLDYAIDDLAI